MISNVDVEAENINDFHCREKPLYKSASDEFCFKTKQNKIKNQKTKIKKKPKQTKKQTKRCRQTDRQLEPCLGALLALGGLE